MEVMKNTITAGTPPRTMTKEAMHLDFEYEMAQRMTRSLYENGMISLDEMNRIMALNKKKFYPFYGDLM